jgi:translation initiation factor IF-2
MKKKRNRKKVIREVKIPETNYYTRTIKSEWQSVLADIIKFLFNMKVVATINHIIDKDTAEYIVKEFGHNPIIEENAQTIRTSKI